MSSNVPPASPRRRQQELEQDHRQQAADAIEAGYRRASRLGGDDESHANEWSVRLGSFHVQVAQAAALLYIGDELKALRAEFTNAIKRDRFR